MSSVEELRAHIAETIAPAAWTAEALRLLEVALVEVREEGRFERGEELAPECQAALDEAQHDSEAWGRKEGRREAFEEAADICSVDSAFEAGTSHRLHTEGKGGSGFAHDVAAKALAQTSYKIRALGEEPVREGHERCLDPDCDCYDAPEPDPNVARCEGCKATLDLAVDQGVAHRWTLDSDGVWLCPKCQEPERLYHHRSCPVTLGNGGECMGRVQCGPVRSVHQDDAPEETSGDFATVAEVDEPSNYVPRDLRPKCCRCGERWRPPEGVDATIAVCPKCKTPFSGDVPDYPVRRVEGRAGASGGLPIEKIRRLCDSIWNPLRWSDRQKLARDILAVLDAQPTAYEPSSDAVETVGERTGAGLHESRDALVESKGDIAAAVSQLLSREGNQ